LPVRAGQISRVTVFEAAEGRADADRMGVARDRQLTEGRLHLLQQQVGVEALAQDILQPGEHRGRNGLLGRPCAHRAARSGAAQAACSIGLGCLSDFRNRYPASTFDGVFDTEKYGHCCPPKARTKCSIGSTMEPQKSKRRVTVAAWRMASHMHRLAAPLVRRAGSPPPSR